ncbi:MAG: hypothetical protein ACI9PP_000086 [Halobacteriales archaeon]|jgi:hypothetical protein
MSRGKIRQSTGEREENNETAIHDVLRNDRRRSVISALSTSGGHVELRFLADQIAEEETGTSPPPKNARKSVYNSLHQTHLPKLAREGVVKYDRNRKLINLNQAREVKQFMHVKTPYGGTWSTVYRTIATFGFLIIMLSLLEVPIVARLDPLLWTSIGLGLVAVSTAYQLWPLPMVYFKRLL